VPDFPPPRFESKIAAREDFAQRAAALARPRIFTNGCFDLMHRGHVTYLAQAAALGAALIVGVNSDDSVRRLDKGRERPLNCLVDRMAVLAALASTALVVAFDEDTPLNLILACRPDILVKGGDWSIEKIVGSREVQSWGGRVVSIPFLYDRSTTALVDRIRG
jgi:D-glycero-beta-D-manno-heptose 1-phosphate adenylyltransferase